MCKLDILKVNGIIKDDSPRIKLPKDAICEVCGVDKDETRMRRFNEYIVCEKHYYQLEKYGKITDPKPREHKSTTSLEKCCICGNRKSASVDGKPYCRKHYMQLYNHGTLLERTIYDSNEYIEHNDYIEVKTYDKNGEYKGSTKIDKKSLELVKNYKICIRKQGVKTYARLTINGKKIFLHRFLMKLKDVRYNLDIAVDHINGDSLDNRLSNLRICKQEDNMKNIKKGNKIIGVGWLKVNKKWTARIMYEYKNIYIGNYSNYYEAVLARITKEKELFKDYGPNKHLYYVIDLPSPIEELQKIIKIPEIPSEGA